MIIKFTNHIVELHKVGVLYTPPLIYVDSIDTVNMNAMRKSICKAQLIE